LKFESFEANVYFTIRDIFNNCSNSEVVLYLNNFNWLLTNEIPYEQRDENFKYTNILESQENLKYLYYLFTELNKSDFEDFWNDEQEDENMNLDDWYSHFLELQEIICSKIK